MRIVVDLGCATRNEADSYHELRRIYNPDLYFGFDPAAEMGIGVDVDQGYAIERKAAWIEDGTLLFHEDGSASRVGEYGHEVECFDFSAWLRDLARPDYKIIVKMDIEGAEVPILKKMIADDTDLLVDELLVEWHGEVVDGYRCPARDWWL